MNSKLLCCHSFSFITFENLIDLVGSSTEHESLEKIWRDSLQECKTHLDRISYDDFKLLMKGQPKEKRRGVSYKASGGMMIPTELNESKSTSLDAVPEVSPDKVHPSCPSLDHLTQEKEQMLADQRRDAWGKKRSKSYEQKANIWEQGSAGLGGEEEAAVAPPGLERDASRALILPGKAGDEGLLRDSTLSPLLVNRALYRKHREMRLAVLDASKQFDKKRTAIRSKSQPIYRASLIMKRGERPPVELEDAHQRALFQAAAKRCGRSRRTRNKTVSDVTGMLMKSPE